MNSIYDSARRELLNAQVNWPTIELTLSAWSGVPDFVKTDTTIANIKGRGHIEHGVSMPVVTTSVSVTGAAQSDTIVLPLVPPGNPITWFTMARKNATTHDASTLIIFIDTARDLPFVPNGLDMVVSPDWLEARGWFLP